MPIPGNNATPEQAETIRMLNGIRTSVDQLKSVAETLRVTVSESFKRNGITDNSIKSSIDKQTAALSNYFQQTGGKQVMETANNQVKATAALMSGKQQKAINPEIDREVEETKKIIASSTKNTLEAAKAIKATSGAIDKLITMLEKNSINKSVNKSVVEDIRHGKISNADGFFKRIGMKSDNPARAEFSPIINNVFKNKNAQTVDPLNDQTSDRLENEELRELQGNAFIEEAEWRKEISSILNFIRSNMENGNKLSIKQYELSKQAAKNAEKGSGDKDGKDGKGIFETAFDFGKDLMAGAAGGGILSRIFKGIKGSKIPKVPGVPNAAKGIPKIADWMSKIPGFSKIPKIAGTAIKFAGPAALGLDIALGQWNAADIKADMDKGMSMDDLQKKYKLSDAERNQLEYNISPYMMKLANSAGSGWNAFINPAFLLAWAAKQATDQTINVVALKDNADTVSTKSDQNIMAASSNGAYLSKNTKTDAQNAKTKRDKGETDLSMSEMLSYTKLKFVKKFSLYTDSAYQKFYAKYNNAESAFVNIFTEANFTKLAGITANYNLRFSKEIDKCNSFAEMMECYTTWVDLFNKDFEKYIWNAVYKAQGDVKKANDEAKNTSKSVMFDEKNGAFNNSVRDLGEKYGGMLDSLSPEYQKYMDNYNATMYPASATEEKGGIKNTVTYAVANNPDGTTSMYKQVQTSLPKSMGGGNTSVVSSQQMTDSDAKRMAASKSMEAGDWSKDFRFNDIVNNKGFLPYMKKQNPNVFQNNINNISVNSSKQTIELKPVTEPR